MKRRASGAIIGLLLVSLLSLLTAGIAAADHVEGGDPDLHTSPTIVTTPTTTSTTTTVPETTSTTVGGDSTTTSTTEATTTSVRDESTTTEQPTTSEAPQVGGETVTRPLPRTGSELGGTALFGGALTILGIALALGARRRRNSFEGA